MTIGGVPPLINKPWVIYPGLTLTLMLFRWIFRRWSAGKPHQQVQHIHHSKTSPGDSDQVDGSALYRLQGGASLVIELVYKS